MKKFDTAKISLTHSPFPLYSIFGDVKKRQLYIPQYSVEKITSTIFYLDTVHISSHCAIEHRAIRCGGVFVRMLSVLVCVDVSLHHLEIEFSPFPSVLLTVMVRHMQRVNVCVCVRSTTKCSFQSIEFEQIKLICTDCIVSFIK